MRYFLSLFCFALFSGTVIAQSKDSLLDAYNARQVGYVDTLPTSFYVTTGILIATNSNQSFTQFIFDRTTTYPPGNTNLLLNPQPTLATAQFGIGAEFASHKRMWMRHRIEAQYFHLKSNFGYDFQQGETQYYLHTQDVVTGSYVMDAMVLSYKFEPSARRFYGSLGINAILGSVVVMESVDHTTTDLYGATTHSNTPRRTWCHANNYPLSLGGGMIFRTPKLIIKPGLSIMPCINNGFFYYMASVSFGWRMYQLTSY